MGTKVKEILIKKKINMITFCFSPVLRTFIKRGHNRLLYGLPRNCSSARFVRTFRLVRLIPYELLVLLQPRQENWQAGSSAIDVLR